MRRILTTTMVLALFTAGHAAAESNAFVFGLQGGMSPSDPLATNQFAGGWLGLRMGGAWRLELSGTFQQAQGEGSDLRSFLVDEALLEADDVLADQIRWTADAVLRVEGLRGKWAFLQSTAGGWAYHYGIGGGVREYGHSTDQSHLAPTALAVAGVDLFVSAWFLLRIDGRLFGHLRRDDTIGMGAELALGLGVYR